MSISVALIGAGAIGELRAAAVAQTPGVSLVAVADIRDTMARSVAAPYGAAATSDWQEAVSRSDVDLVIVSTPPNLHAEIALAAISSGKHVLCEKPLAATLADAARMCEAAARAGVMLNTGFNHRYFPSMKFARKLIDSGRLGDVISVQAYAGHPGGKEFGHDWVHDGAVTGGGSLVDNGIHILDLTRYFLGNTEITDAKGYTANLIWPFETAEDNGFALFRTNSGAIVQLHASWTDWRGYRFWVEAVGTKGYVRASYPPMLAQWGTTPKPGLRARRRYNIFPYFQLQERRKSWRWTIVRSFVEELTDLVVGIHGGQSVSATGDDGLRAMQLADAIYRSSCDGVEVSV